METTGISIVICGTSTTKPQSLVDNIALTIGAGIQYEIIYIDNTQSTYSIFQAYNSGFDKANYSYVCFMHQDIEYQCEGWGEMVFSCFSDEKVGMLGVIGSKYIGKRTLGWWASYSKCGSTTDDEHGLMQHSTFCEEVVSLDGLWLTIRKSVYPKFRFDDKTFDGFHCYDMDACLQLHLLGYKILVVPSILIHHFSGGNSSIDFYKNSIKLRIKYEKYFPIFIEMDEGEKECNRQYEKVKVLELKQRLRNIPLSYSGLSECAILVPPYCWLINFGCFVDVHLHLKKSPVSLFLFKMSFQMVRIASKVYKTIGKIKS